MYRYWTKTKNLSGVQLILISKEAWRFDDPEVKKRLSTSSKLQHLWSQGQGQQIKNIPYYYKIATIKDQGLDNKANKPYHTHIKIGF